MTAGERLTCGDGTSESAWQAWPGLAGLPALAVDDVLPADARLVVVAPHPDDEVLACGGLLSLHAGRGGRLLLLAVTDGESSHPGSSVWSPQRLADARWVERQHGLARLLGRQPAAARSPPPVPPVPPDEQPSAVPPWIRLGLADGAVAAGAQRLEAELRRCLRPADRVVTTWRLDGHPDHEATGTAAARACASIGCRLVEAPVWMWHWATPGDPRVPWQRLHALALPAGLPERKRLAMAEHATQWAPRDTGDGPVLGTAMRERLQRRVEYFFV